MKTLLKMLVPCAVLLLASIATVAQSPPAASGETAPAACVPSSQGYGPLQVSAFTGCPFSAVVEIVFTRTLSDGSHVQTKIKALSYRDSHGRVGYRSLPGPDADEDSPEEASMIEIYDPVAGLNYMIVPQRSTAWRSALKPSAASSVPGDAAPGAAAQASTAKGAPGDKSDMADKAKTPVENLGSRQMEGLMAVGTRSTKVTKATVGGSDKDFTVTTELWVAPDFGITLLKTVSDPRSHDSETRVTKLVRSEPDAAWFRVPEGFAVVNQ